jgi:hypothetical protein
MNIVRNILPHLTTNIKLEFKNLIVKYSLAYYVSFQNVPKQIALNDITDHNNQLNFLMYLLGMHETS